MRRIIFPLLAYILLSACSSSKNSLAKRGDAEITRQGFINCFDTIVVDGLNNPVHCEASAVVLSDHSLIIASDKELPGNKLSPVFSIPLASSFAPVIPATSVSYLTNEAFLNVRKIEDMTKEPAGNICFATTGFDRIRDTTASMDPYNSLLYWQENNYNSISYVGETIDNGFKSSKGLRKIFKKALATDKEPGGPAYFKIEAICALPDSTLLFGVRETGRSYADMDYACIVLSTRYHVYNNILSLDSVFKKCFEIKPKESIGIDAALSGIAYNKYHKEIYFSTSVEEFSNTDSIRLSAYLWKVSLNDFHEQKPAQILKDNSGNPLRIDHKVEGITIISKNKLFAISDQDRSLSPILIDGVMIDRKPNQAVYSIIKTGNR